MKRALSFMAGALGAAIVCDANAAQAHIKMLKPAPWIVEDDGFAGVAGGNPQKFGPCGPGPSDKPTLTNAVTTFQAGETITVQWTETVAHPGYFRIALAENRADLKDPTLSFNNNCDIAKGQTIPTGAHDNVLADGILIQAKGGPARPGFPDFSHQVTLPNKSCEKCTLQLIQFMEDHSTPCIYYHCADIKIVAAAAGDAGVDAGSSAPKDGGVVDAGTTGSITNDASTTGTDAMATSPSAGGAAGGTTPGAAGGTTSGGAAGGTVTTNDRGAAGAAAAGGAGTTGGGAAPGSAPSDEDDGGCSVSFARDRTSATWIAVSLALLATLLRRMLRRGKQIPSHCGAQRI